MVSIKVKSKKLPPGTFQPQVAIQGKVYYFIGSLEVSEQEEPKFASLYVHDPALEGVSRKTCS